MWTSAKAAPGAAINAPSAIASLETKRISPSQRNAKPNLPRPEPGPQRFDKRILDPLEGEVYGAAFSALQS